MNLLKTIIVLLLITFVSGCSVVKSEHKLGAQHYIINKDEWHGTWISEDGELQIIVTDQASGEIEILFIDNEQLLQHKIYLTRTDSDTYMNLLEKPEDHFYYPAKFKKTSNQLIVWLLSPEALKKAINNKQLKGIITEQKYSDDVLITADKNELNRFFIENGGLMLFNSEDPLILKRLVK